MIKDFFQYASGIEASANAGELRSNTNIEYRIIKTGKVT
jgi:hypothetical protein